MTTGAAALRAPLDRFVFGTEAWVQPAALWRLVAGDGGAAGPGDRPPDAAALRRAVAATLPPRELPLDLLTGGLVGRLALLPRADWLRLGLCLALLPLRGQILRSMDGHFRRAVRLSLDEATLAALDQRPAGDGLRSLLGAGAWRAPDQVAAGGVVAALDQACRWPAPVRQRFGLQFSAEELAQPPSVAGLDPHSLEIACKASWPDHPWLWC